MNWLEVIMEKLDERIDEVAYYDYHIKNLVIRHLKRANDLFDKAKLEKDPELFTEVIMRTNHAYEGMLEVAYLVFTGGFDICLCDPDIDVPDVKCNLPIYKLEQYFEENKLINERVKNSFRAYRTEWRNPSTHGQDLRFLEEDACLAISSVSAFIYILFNMMESYQEDRGEEFSLLFLTEIGNIAIEKFVVKKLKIFNKYPIEDERYKYGKPIKKVVIEAINEYLISEAEKYEVYEGIDFIAHYKGEEVLGYQPDIVIKENDDDMIVLEVQLSYTNKNLELGYKHLSDYLLRTEASTGILYFYTENNTTGYQEKVEKIEDKEIIMLIPHDRYTYT